jgi:EAL domain-containing protein (putative c-di-GMP-specific phosphodiesterase class I)/GGDEF domain-containing protein
LDSTPSELPAEPRLGPLLVLGAPSPACDELRALAQRRNQAFLIAADLERAREILAGRQPEFIVLASAPGRSPEQTLAQALGESPQEGALHDRNQFLTQLSRSLDHAQLRKSVVAVLCVDLAHGEGGLQPEYLSAIYGGLEERLRSCLRDRDVLALMLRDGAPQIPNQLPHRFTLVLELRRAQDAGAVARRLSDLLGTPLTLPGSQLPPSFSLGIALFPQDGIRAEDLLRMAQTASEDARADGKHPVRYCSDAMNKASLELISMEAALRRAIDQQQFEVFYQPKVAIQGERIVGFEALVRWRHPELGLVPPVQFIPMAEETGMIIEIGAFVLRQACRDAVAWQRAGLPPILMAVNISSVQFGHPDLYTQVLTILEEEGLAPQQLELELTESMLMGDAEAAVAVLNRFKKHGIQIAIDDFGTGYSSLAYLKRLPVGKVKIDISFVRDMLDDHNDYAIVNTIIGMGRTLEMTTLAEGVETSAQAETLLAMGCLAAQGYHFGAPESAAAFARRWLM